MALNPNSLTLLEPFIFSPLRSVHLHHLLTSCLLCLFPSYILKAVSFLQADRPWPSYWLCTCILFSSKDFSQACSASQTRFMLSLYGPRVRLNSPLLSEVSKGGRCSESNSIVMCSHAKLSVCISVCVNLSSNRWKAPEGNDSFSLCQISSMVPST